MASRWFRWVGGKFVEIGEEPKEKSTWEHVMTDEIPPTKNVLNMKTYTSRKKLEAESRARGYEHIGNELPSRPEYVDYGKLGRRQACIEALKIEKERGYRREYNRRAGFINTGD